VRSIDLRSLRRGPRAVAICLTTLALAAAVFALAGRFRRPAQPTAVPSDPAPEPGMSNGGVGKAGELVVSQEAMDLAEIRVGLASQRLVTEKLAATGVVEAGGDRLVKVTPRVAGKVISVAVVVGDAVRAGQTLALMESAELARAQATYQQAAARVTVARNNLERQRKLAGLGVFGVPRVEEARKESAAAQGEVNSAVNEAAAARTEVAEARSRRAAFEAEVASAEGEAASAESEIAEAESHLGVLSAAFSQAETQVNVTQSRFNRVDRLLSSGVTSRQQWEVAQADVQKSQADVAAARANIAQGQAKVATTRSHLRSTKAKVQAAQAHAQQSADAVETALARQYQAEAKLDAARKRVEIAQQTLTREQAVFQGGHLTSKEIVEAEASLRQAELDRQAGAQNVRLLGAEPGGGSRIAVTAPIAGRIQERSVSPGETVGAERPLFTVLNLDLVWIALAVAPQDLPNVRVGQRVELISETAPGRTFTGSVSAVGSVADEKTRTVSVRCALVNRDGALRPETFVRGNIVTDVRRERVTVPVGAIQDHSGKMTVYVGGPVPGAFEVRHVKLGIQDGGWREIASGLRPGERIAVRGTFYLKSEALKSSLSDACCAVDKK
jgi:RND family efflux transporter MFP subunit